MTDEEVKMAFGKILTTENMVIERLNVMLAAMVMLEENGKSLEEKVKALEKKLEVPAYLR